LNVLEIAEDKMHAGKHHLQIVRRKTRKAERGGCAADEQPRFVILDVDEGSI
jgi:hypothetical protein